MNVYRIKELQVLITLLLFSLSVSAQNFILTGTVFDAKTAQPLPGVTIINNGTGTVTDFDGKFVVNVLILS